MFKTAGDVLISFGKLFQIRSAMTN